MTTTRFEVDNTEPAPERAVVAAMLTQGADEDAALEEIRELLRTAG